VGETIAATEIEVAPILGVVRNVTVGAEAYPVPPLIMLTEVTTPAVSTAVPVAPVPPPPEKTTLMALVYRVPPVPTVTEDTTAPVRTAVAVAPEPAPAVTVTGMTGRLRLGREVCSLRTVEAVRTVLVGKAILFLPQ